MSRLRGVLLDKV